MSSELKDVLKKRLDENYTAFIAALQGKTVSELIAMAPEITAAQQLHDELLDACDGEDVAFLLQFDDPLEVVRGYWESEITGYDHSGEMGHMLWEIRDRELYAKERNHVMQTITTDDLRKMEDQEGLVLQGCGGDPQEWVDGINDLLTEAGILLDGSKFENVSSFQHDGLTCLLFPFEDVKLDMGRLAMWRLQTHGQFGGTCGPAMVGSLLMEQGFFPAYHMNKNNWITILLNGPVPNHQITFLLQVSYDSVAPKRRSRKQIEA